MVLVLVLVPLLFSYDEKIHEVILHHDYDAYCFDQGLTLFLINL